MISALQKAPLDQRDGLEGGAAAGGPEETELSSRSKMLRLARPRVSGTQHMRHPECRGSGRQGGSHGGRPGLRPGPERAPWCQRSCSFSCSLPHIPTYRNDPRQPLRDPATHSGRPLSASHNIVFQKQTPTHSARLSSNTPRQPPRCSGAGGAPSSPPAHTPSTHHGTAELSCLRTCHLPQLSPHTWPRVSLEWASIVRGPGVNEGSGFGQLVGQMAEQKTGRQR